MGARKFALILCLDLIVVVIASLAWGAGVVRYKAHLDPPGLELTEFKTGKLMGWYVYLDVGGVRTICANPMVWDGPKVITCDHVVATEEKP